MIKSLRSFLGFEITLAFVVALSTPVSATMVTSILSTDFSGSKSSTGVITATFDDGGGPGPVTLTIDTSGLTPSSSFISDFWFNFTGDATTLTLTPSSGPTPPTIEKCDGFACLSSFEAEGDGTFDIHLAWPTNAMDLNRFDAGDTFSMTITDTTITASDFDDLSLPSLSLENMTTWCTAAHVQGTGTGDGSDHLGGLCLVVPEPSQQGVPEATSLLFLGAGLVGLGAMARKTRRYQVPPS